MRRANYIGVPAFFNLNLVCRAITEAFGHFGLYLVGSSLERKDYRDVDLRYILPDEEFKIMFGGPVQNGYNAKFAILNAALSEWINNRTGLPVDFQFQAQTEANEKFPGSRSAIGIFFGEAK